MVLTEISRNFLFLKCSKLTCVYLFRVLARTPSSWPALLLGSSIASIGTSLTAFSNAESSCCLAHKISPSFISRMALATL